MLWKNEGIKCIHFDSGNFGATSGFANYFEMMTDEFLYNITVCYACVRTPGQTQWSNVIASWFF